MPVIHETDPQFDQLGTRITRRQFTDMNGRVETTTNPAGPAARTDGQQLAPLETDPHHHESITLAATVMQQRLMDAAQTMGNEGELLEAAAEMVRALNVSRKIYRDMWLEEHGEKERIRLRAEAAVERVAGLEINPLCGPEHAEKLLREDVERIVRSLGGNSGTVAAQNLAIERLQGRVEVGGRLAAVLRNDARGHLIQIYSDGDPLIQAIDGVLAEWEAGRRVA